MTTAVKGYRELATIFAKSGKETRKELPLVMRQAAEPVERDAETLAGTKIRRIGDQWKEMRTGVTRTLVYVAPKQRGIKTRGAHPRKRKKFAKLMMDRALEPALHKNEADVARRVDHALDRLANEFNRGGPIT